jgi:hypothetical protein
MAGDGGSFMPLVLTCAFPPTPAPAPAPCEHFGASVGPKAADESAEALSSDVAEALVVRPQRCRAVVRGDRRLAPQYNGRVRGRREQHRIGAFGARDDRGPCQGCDSRLVAD